jgi:hypothetical protein
MTAAHGGGHGRGLPWLAPILNSSELRGLCCRTAAHGGGHGRGLPWLDPIRNSSELRGLCCRSGSCFGPRMCGTGITNYRNVSGLSIRVSPSHPYNAGRAGLRWGGVGGSEEMCTLHAVALCTAVTVVLALSTVTVCVFITAGPITKLFAGGQEESIQYSVMFVRGNGIIHRGQKPASRG